VRRWANSGPGTEMAAPPNPQGFSYAEFTTRNVGFVTEAEQQRLLTSRVLVIGVGGMGGAALQALARAGVGGFGIADIDTFEISNLNRQVFADLDSINEDKAAATAQRLRRINPELSLEVFGPDWCKQLDALLSRYSIVINGMDDIIAGIDLYRRARVHGATVIDAYTASLPSVTVVRPSDPRPEDRLGCPSRGKDVTLIDQNVRMECFLREMEHVLVHSSTVRHIDMRAAFELLAGKRKRMSFAPMVITTGNLMAFEVVKLLLGRKPTADCRGYFFNPWSMRVEHPLPGIVAAPKRILVRRFLARMARD
jgi:molybdopterin-synthase adenylyltransferase